MGMNERKKHDFDLGDFIAVQRLLNKKTSSYSMTKTEDESSPKIRDSSDYLSSLVSAI